MDPRVKTALADLQKQHDLSMICYEGRKKCLDVLSQIKQQKENIKSKSTKRDSTAAKSFRDLNFLLSSLETSPPGSKEISFDRLGNNFASLMNILQDNDMPPTSQIINAVRNAEKQLNDLIKKWNAYQATQ